MANIRPDLFDSGNHRNHGDEQARAKRHTTDLTEMGVKALLTIFSAHSSLSIETSSGVRTVLIALSYMNSAQATVARPLLRLLSLRRKR